MLGDAIAAALPELRAHAESMMVDAIRIDRQRLDGSGDPVQTMDPVTLELTDVYDLVHEGKARVQRTDLQAQEPVVGGVEHSVERLDVQLPITVTGIKHRDRVTVTAVGVISDPDLLGLVATVMTNAAKTHATKRTLACEVVG